MRRFDQWIECQQALCDDDTAIELLGATVMIDELGESLDRKPMKAPALRR